MGENVSPILKKAEKLQASQPHLNPWEGGGATNPSKTFKGDWKASPRICEGEIMSDPLISLL